MSAVSPAVQSWSTAIPESWDLRRLKTAARVIMGQSPPSSEYNERGDGRPFLQGNAEFGVRHPTPRLYCEAANKTVTPGDLLLSVRAPVGSLNEADAPYGIGRGLCGIRPSDGLDKRFLFYFLATLGQLQLQIESSGSTYQAVSIDDVASLWLPYPPSETQQAIADFLDLETAKIDMLIEKKERLLELLDEKRTALITRAVTRGLDPDVPLKDSGVEWMGEIPAHWDLIQLRRACRSAIAGPFGSSLTKDMYGGDRYRVYGQQQVIPNDFTKGDYYIPEGAFRDLRRFETKPGDLLISCMGTVGRAAVVPDHAEPGIINPRLVRLRLREDVLGPSYVPLVLRSEPVQYHIERMSRGGTMGGLNLTIVSQIIVPLPPPEEQEKIKSFLGREEAKLDQLANKVQDAVKLLHEYRAALISAVVTSKVEVPEQSGRV